jgi:hypothetical protein
MSSAPRPPAHEVAEAAARDELEDLSRWRAPELPQDDPGPCPGCASWSRCEARLEACEAFFLYTKLQQWATAPRQPSREVYDRLFSRRFRVRGEQLDGMTVIERRAAAQELAAGGCSSREIAEVVGICRSTVKSYLKRGRRRRAAKIAM